MKLAQKIISLYEKEMSLKDMHKYIEKKFIPKLIKASKANKVPTFLPSRIDVKNWLEEDTGVLPITFIISAGKGLIELNKDGSFNNEDDDKVSEKEMIDDIIGTGQIWRSRADDKEKEEEDKRKTIKFNIVE